MGVVTRIILKVPVDNVMGMPVFRHDVLWSVGIIVLQLLGGSLPLTFNATREAPLAEQCNAVVTLQ